MPSLSAAQEMTPTGVLLDTNVASYLFEETAESTLYLRRIEGRLLFISLVSVAELRYGALNDNWGDARKQRLEGWIQTHTVLSVDDETARAVAILMNERRRAGRRLEWSDAWIAATAISHHLPLVTHDRDFFYIDGLEIITELRGLEVREPCREFGNPPEATPEIALEWLHRYVTALESGRTLQ